MDYYDHAVAYLTKRPGEIADAWGDVWDHPAGRLFGYATPTRSGIENRPDGKSCGCLTTIRFTKTDFAWTDSLTEAIRADENIPAYTDRIGPEHLPHFSRWQRRIDAELGRTPPVWAEPEAANA